MSPEQVTEPVTGSLDDELDQFAAVFTILGSLHYQVPDADHLHELLQMIDEWPLSRPRSPSRMEEGLQMWRLSREEAESRQVVVADHDRLYGDSAVALVPTLRVSASQPGGAGLRRTHPASACRLRPSRACRTSSPPRT